MTDRNVQFPNRFRLVPVPGSDGIYDIEPVPGEVFDEGTFLNKASLLKDATAALLGLTGAAVPDEAFAKLRQLVQTAQSVANGKAKISNGSYTGTGQYGQNNPTSLTFSFEPHFLVVSGVYFEYELNANWGSAIIWIDGILSSAVPNTREYRYIKKSGNTVSWYSSISSHYQLNKENSKYYYFAIG